MVAWLMPAAAVGYCHLAASSPRGLRGFMKACFWAAVVLAAWLGGDALLFRRPLECMVAAGMLAWNVVIVRRAALRWVPFLLLLSCGATLGLWGLSAVTTRSVPLGLYTTRPLATDEVPSRGDFVCFAPGGERAPKVLRRLLSSGLLPSSWWTETFIKIVGAVPGDHVARAPNGQLRVNGRLLAQSSRYRAERYEPLPTPTLPRELNDHEVWLSSAHPKGFDSRYFGPVGIDSLTCKGELLWSWGS